LQNKGGSEAALCPSTLFVNVFYIKGVVNMGYGLIGTVLIVLLIAALLQNVYLGGIGGLALLVLLVLLLMGRL
jgi:hypothetical protein